MSRTDKDGPHHPRTGLKLLAGGGGPPRWFINAVWTSKERQATRAACRTAIEEYRAAGNIKTTPIPRQHRHGAQWLWW